MENIDEIAMSHFPNINREQALQRPILYSNWMDKNYIPVDREELRHYVKARLVFIKDNGHQLLMDYLSRKNDQPLTKDISQTGHE